MLQVRLYISLLAVSCATFGIGLILTVLLLPPTAGLGLLLFYLTLAICSFSFFTLIGLYIRRLFGSRELVNQYLVTSSRQGLWFAVILSAAMGLLSNRFFSWVNALFLVLTFVFLEFYLMTKNDRKP